MPFFRNLGITQEDWVRMCLDPATWTFFVKYCDFASFNLEYVHALKDDTNPNDVKWLLLTNDSITPIGEFATYDELKTVATKLALYGIRYRIFDTSLMGL